MACTECGEVIVTKIFTDIRPDQNRVWFWALRCSQCGHLADAGLRLDTHAYTPSWEHPLWKSHCEN